MARTFFDNNEVTALITGFIINIIKRFAAKINALNCKDALKTNQILPQMYPAKKLTNTNRKLWRMEKTQLNINAYPLYCC